MKDITIHINSDSEKIIKSHAEQTYPFECCGFLFGHDGNERVITFAKPVKNSKKGDQRRRFEIGPLDYLKAEKYADENDLNLVGIYHSHPDHPAIASFHDLKKAMPFFSYVIISVNGGKVGDLKSWKLKNDIRQFTEEKINIYELLEIDS